MGKEEVPGWLSAAKGELDSLLLAQKVQEAAEIGRLELEKKKGVAAWKETISSIDSLLQMWNKLGLSKVLHDAALFYEELPFVPSYPKIDGLVPRVYRDYALKSEDFSNVLVLLFAGKVEEEGRNFLGKIRKKQRPVSLEWEIVINPSMVPENVIKHLGSDIKSAGDQPLYYEGDLWTSFRNPLDLVLERYQGHWPFNSWVDFKISLWGGIYHTERWPDSGDGNGYESEEYNIFPIGVDKENLFINHVSFPLSSINTPTEIQKIVDGELAKKVKAYSSANSTS